MKRATHTRAARPLVATVRMDAQAWLVLSELAALRAERVGGRPDRAAVLEELLLAAAPPEKPEGQRS